MKTALVFLSLLASLPALAKPCNQLAKLPLANATITSAEIINPGNPLLTQWKLTESLPPFCRVAATLTPSADSNIRIEIWLPAASQWNGKYEGTGNGGYAGNIAYKSLAGALSRGYAVANTDMGTAPVVSNDGSSLTGHPEKWEDWGWRATHVMTVAAKQIVAAYYERAPQHSYFVGCSTGGEQALMEAQRFPADYDGIVGGAPAHARTHLHMDILWNFAVPEKELGGMLSPEKLALVEHAALAACSRQKAVGSDEFLSDPMACHWSPRTLVCHASESANCLTEKEAEVVEKLYEGPRSVYPGVPRGSEFGWGAFIPANGKPPYTGLFHWTFGADWPWQSFDFNKNVATVDDKLAQAVNATNPDLSPFRALGHKIIVYHGSADWLVPPEETVLYSEQVKDPGNFYRLFMVPGMAHCSGGPGLNTFDALPALEAWVETGTAPKEIVAHRKDGDTIKMARPVCPYPDNARYIGGDPNQAGSFACSASQSQPR